MVFIAQSYHSAQANRKAATKVGMVMRRGGEEGLRQAGD
jgi:hypothetical protein